MLKRFSCFWAVWLMFSLFPASAFASDCVILLHGLARSKASMAKLEQALIKEQYKTVNIGYPSRKYNIETLAKQVIPESLEQCTEADNLHFVTHSLGGILVRQYLSTQAIPRLKHVVMLGPPNKGSEVVDRLSAVPGFKFMNGPAGLQLGTNKNSVPNTLGDAHFSLGVIAGTRSMNLVLSTMLPNPDDGKVSVESTRLKGMQDHISLPTTHTFMMRNKKVIEQVIYFLNNGKFSRDKTYSHY